MSYTLTVSGVAQSDDRGSIPGTGKGSFL